MIADKTKTSWILAPDSVFSSVNRLIVQNTIQTGHVCKNEVSWGKPAMEHLHAFWYERIQALVNSCNT